MQSAIADLLVGIMEGNSKVGHCRLVQSYDLQQLSHTALHKTEPSVNKSVVFVAGAVRSHVGDIDLSSRRADIL